MPRMPRKSSRSRRSGRSLRRPLVLSDEKRITLEIEWISSASPRSLQNQRQHPWGDSPEVHAPALHHRPALAHALPVLAGLLALSLLALPQLAPALARPFRPFQPFQAVAQALHLLAPAQARVFV